MTSIDTLRIKEHIFVHESGHAIIGVLKDNLHIEGIGFCTTDESYITVVNGPASDNRTRNFYVFLAGGMTAELLIYDAYEPGPATKDIEFFNESGAPPLQQPIDEAKIFLSSYRQQIKYLKSCLMSKDVDKGRFKDEIVIGNPDRNVRYLLKNGELEDPIRNWEGFCARLETEGS
jgi:hypothetical protein